MNSFVVTTNNRDGI